MPSGHRETWAVSAVWACIPSGELAAPTNDINVTTFLAPRIYLRWLRRVQACGVGRVLETSETVLNRSLSVADELTLDLVPVADDVSKAIYPKLVVALLLLVAGWFHYPVLSIRLGSYPLPHARSLRLLILEDVTAVLAMNPLSRAVPTDFLSVRVYLRSETTRSMGLGY